MITRRAALAGAATLPLIARAQAQSAASWPTRPVRFIVPYPPGGAQDVLARMVCEQLQTRLGQPFVVENRAGAAGNVGVDVIAKSAPDGYTIGATPSGILTVNQFLYPMPFNPERDLTPVSLLWGWANVVVVAPGHVPVTTMRDLAPWAKEQGRGVFYGISFVGTTGHLITELYRQRTGIDAQHLAVGGGAQIQLSLLRGEAQFAFDGGAPAFAPAIRDGQLRALAVTSPQRWPALPDVPTLAEAGFPDIGRTSWTGLAAPAGTPEPVINRLASAIRDIAADPTLTRRAFAAGGQIMTSTPAEMRAMADEERPIWRDVIRSLDIRVG